MGLTTSLFTGLTGLDASAQTIAITGNNIANINTTAFKSSRADFQTQITRNLRAGTAPTTTLGGTNPLQIGLGTQLSSITRNFKDGSLQLTGINTDVAIEGSGFFVVNDNGFTKFTRAGTFKLDRDANLTTNDGALVQGFSIDEDFNVLEGVLANVNIPLGAITLAEATGQVNLQGNLDASGEVAQNGSIQVSDPLFSDAAATIPAVAADSLINLFDAAGTQLFAPDDTITVTGVTKGGAVLADKTFQVGPANTTASDANGQTLTQFMEFLRAIIGIDTSVGGGISVDADGQIVVESNTGVENGIKLDQGNIIRNQGTDNQLPLVFNATQQADGESVRTSFFAFDSLGAQMVLDIAFVLEDKSNTGTQWRYYAQSKDDSDLDRVLGNGVLSFDTNGQFLNVSDETIVIDRNGTGAFSPQQITLSFNQTDSSNGRSTGISALTAANQISAVSQDGFPVGTLADFNIDGDGTIVGIFSNSQQRNLGRIVLATFTNPDGLIDDGRGLYQSSTSTGNPSILTPGTGGAGRVVSEALELSNVDLSQEFIALIMASTGFSANSRVLVTSDRLLQELLATLR